MAIIYAFGDSITYGAWDIRLSGWASRLRLFLDEKLAKDSDLYYLLYNLGIPGENTQGLIKRFSAETTARVRKDEEAVFIFAYGANDLVFLKNENRFRVPKDEFVSNLDGVIREALTLSSKVILINIVPVLEDVFAAHTHNKNKSRSNKDIREYNEALADLAKKHSLPLVDAHSVFMDAGHEKLFAEDGLHPNEDGHRLLFEAVKDTVGGML